MANKSLSKTSKLKKNRTFLGRIWHIIFNWTLILCLIGSMPFTIWIWWLDKKVVARFEGQKWQIPSEVLSAPIYLKSGSPWHKKELESLLKETGYRFGLNSKKVGWATRSQTKVSVHLRSYVSYDGYHPSERRVFTFIDDKLYIQSLNGDPVAEASIEPQKIGFLYGGNTEQRQILTYNDIPKSLIAILVSVEDRYFYHHWGISPTGITRAVWVNINHKSHQQGGSTLTQQLVKNMFLSSDRTYSRKLTEIVMSLLLEYHYSKEAIITAYINEVYLAQVGNEGLYGFAAASQHFFGRPLKELNIDEFALLVGMVKGPSYYNPERHPKRALYRRNTVLTILRHQNLLTPSDYHVLVKQPIHLADKRRQRSMYGDYLDLVSIQLSQDFDKETLATKNLHIYTGLDIRAQLAASQAMQKQGAILEKTKKSLSGLQGAMVVTERKTGQVRVVVGSIDKYYSGFNRALGAVRPIGSLVKPPLYMAALATKKYTWWTKIEDKRIRFDIGGTIWEPKNYDRTTHGVVHLYEAMAKSYNLATVNLAQQIGFNRVADTLRQLGVKRQFTMYPAITLGALELSPFEVARMYQPIASRGHSSELQVVLAVMDQYDNLVRRFDHSTKMPFTNALLAATLDNMTKVPKIGTARQAQSVFPDLTFAAKTGTSNGQRDSWFEGISGEYASTIWLGDDDNKTLSINGATGAQQVWIDFTKHTNPISLPKNLPEGALRYDVLDNSFEIAAKRCKKRESLVFLLGTQPTSSTSCFWPF